MTHPQRGRLVAVLGERQGSGYLIGPNLVLTAAHVVQAGGFAFVAVPGHPDRMPCRVEWHRHDEECDAALLVLGSARPTPTPDDPEPPAWGEWLGLEPQADAMAVGFPHVQRDGSGRLDTEQLVGTLKPATGLLGGRPVLDNVHGAPLGDRPWSGLSGAPVFLGGTLMGLVRAEPAAWGHGRVELTPGHVLLADPEFRRAVGGEGLRVAPGFESRLRSALAREWNRVTIFGVTRSSALEDSWPLDVAYISLELSGGGAPALHEEGQEPLSRRVEDAFSGQRRVLLRGEAGSGKTTLLQWLTTLAARGRLPDSLRDFQGCVPVLLRLRALARDGAELPGPEEFLRAAGSPLAGAPGSEGWMSRRLAEGRILLLVDGIDEAPTGERRRVREWLSRLLAAYPRTRCVVTTRPSAVHQGWLRELDFEELSLLPMGRGDVRAFVDRWHQAARQSTPHRAGLLDDWQRQLTEALDRKPDLARLATNPLMCSLICALNVDRRGYLPADRMSLYDAALEMLLVRRDQERGVAADSEGLSLGRSLQQALLEKLAYWLVRNGQSELTEEQALRLLDRARPQMGLDAAPDALLRHLLVRSGLLREPAPGSVDFVHRTFQDYLGAQAAIEEGDIPLLVARAHEDQWEDVLRLAVGHARRRERAELLTLLLDRADAEPAHTHRLRLLAAICLELAVELDPAIRHRIEQSTAELVPPRSVEEAKALAHAGPLVLELLPGPDGLTDEEALAVVTCATTVAGERAIPLLRAYAGHPFVKVQSQLSWAWDRFDTREYGEQIIAGLTARDDLFYVVREAAEADFLAELGGRPLIEFDGAAHLSVLRPLSGTLEALRVESLVLDEEELAALRQFPRLERLRLNRCAFTDLAPLARTGVRCLTVSNPSTPLTGLAELTDIEDLDLWDCRPFLLPELPRLSRLTLDPADRFTAEDLAVLPSLTLLREFQLFRGTFPDLGPLVLPQVTSLHLTAVTLTPDRAAQIPHVFPGLRSITVRAMTELDLLPPGYRITEG